MWVIIWMWLYESLLKSFISKCSVLQNCLFWCSGLERTCQILLKLLNNRRHCGLPDNTAEATRGHWDYQFPIERHQPNSSVLMSLSELKIKTNDQYKAAGREISRVRLQRLRKGSSGHYWTNENTLSHCG